MSASKILLTVVAAGQVAATACNRVHDVPASALATFHGTAAVCAETPIVEAALSAAFQDVAVNAKDSCRSETVRQGCHLVQAGMVCDSHDIGVAVTVYELAAASAWLFAFFDTPDTRGLILPLGRSDWAPMIDVENDEVLSDARERAAYLQESLAASQAVALRHSTDDADVITTVMTAQALVALEQENRAQLAALTAAGAAAEFDPMTLAPLASLFGSTSAERRVGRGLVSTYFLARNMVLGGSACPVATAGGLAEVLSSPPQLFELLCGAPADPALEAAERCAAATLRQHVRELRQHDNLTAQTATLVTSTLVSQAGSQHFGTGDSRGCSSWVALVIPRLMSQAFGQLVSLAPTELNALLSDDLERAGITSIAASWACPEPLTAAGNCPSTLD